VLRVADKKLLLATAATTPLGYPSLVERDLVLSLRAGLSAQVLLLLDTFFEKLTLNLLVEPSFIRAACLELLSAATHALAEMGLTTESASYCASGLERCPNLPALKAQLGQLLTNFAQQVVEQRNAKNKSPVERAIEFIRTNLNREISLDDVASYTHFTSSYLANLFKKATGETVVEYISRLKMEKAAELVCNPDAKIAAVAQSLGYSDRRYFSELFRRRFGCTPSEYRDKFLGLKESSH
jgi:two-component system response regulator YesN